MTTIQKTATISATLGALVAVSVLEAQQNLKLHENIRDLQSTVPKVEELVRRREQEDKQLDVLRAENGELKRRLKSVDSTHNVQQPGKTER